MNKRLAVVVVAPLAGIALAWVLIPGARDEAEGLAPAIISGADEGATRAADAPDLVALELSADNTAVSFSCAKTVAGKTAVVRGGWSGSFGGEIDGMLGLDPRTRVPRRLRARVRIASLWSEHEQLTDALLTKGFFQPGAHPWATFEGGFRQIAPADGTETGPHAGLVAVGSFELNGIRKRIEFPVDTERADGAMLLTSAFSLDRHAFGVRFTEPGGFGLLTDDAIADAVAVTLRIELPLTAGDEPTDAPPTTVATEAPAAEPDTDAELPPAYTETIRDTQVSFEMVRVPANDQAGLGPFYIGRHEVTWDEFMPWVQGEDLADETRVGEERAMKLRPSSPYGSVDRNFGMRRRPALGMSRRSAELYCAWLSEQTGKAYRLPTEAEWEWAYEAGGHDPHHPPSSGEADRIATYRDNSWNDSIGDWATTCVGQREANTLGIHDMAGNVAEWVVPEGGAPVVRGGHFEAPLAELGVGRATEAMDAWNRDYPNEPKSPWWYVNARWVGFRVLWQPPSAEPAHPRPSESSR